MHDLTTLAGARALAADIMKSTTRLMAMQGHIAPTAFIFATRDPRDGKPFADDDPVGVIVVSPTTMEDEEEQTVFIEAVRKTALAGKAVGVVLVLEMWMMVAQTREEAMTLKPRTDPRRQEGVLASLEHADGVAAWRAPILRVDIGNPTLGEWSEGQGGLMGKFAELLGPRGTVH